MTRDQAARLLRKAQQRPDHNQRLACGYGVHDCAIDDPEPGYKRCRKCGATYLVDLDAIVAAGETRRQAPDNPQTHTTEDTMTEGGNVYKIHWLEGLDADTTVRADDVDVDGDRLTATFYRREDDGNGRTVVHIAHWLRVRDIQLIDSNVDGTELSPSAVMTLPTPDDARPPVDADDEVRNPEPATAA